MDISIRPGLLSDSQRLCEISSRAHLSDFYLNTIPQDHLSAFKKRYTLSVEQLSRFNRRYTKRLSDPEWHYYIAHDNDRVYGYTCCKLTSDILQLKGLFVDPQFQSRGVGKSLLQASLAPAPKDTPIQLEVLPSNDGAKRLYERYGFYSAGTSETLFFGVPLEVMEQG